MKRWFVGGLSLFFALFLVVSSVHAQTKPVTRGQSGLPLPRYVSLKSNRVNVRLGPSREHDVAWVFVKASLPVEVIQEFENWRRIRDHEGAEGWVFHALLSGLRTAIVTPWDKDKTSLNSLHAKPSETSKIRAKLGAGVVTTLIECTGTWCRVRGKGKDTSYDGWIKQELLWGVYPDEEVGR